VGAGYVDVEAVARFPLLNTARHSVLLDLVPLISSGFLVVALNPGNPGPLKFSGMITAVTIRVL